MENNLQHEGLEKNLMEQLSRADVSNGHLSRISRSIAALHRSGFQVIDWSIFGKPAFERFVVDTQLPFENATSLQELLVNKDFKEIFIFRKGIPPMPNFFNVKMTFENA